MDRITCPLCIDKTGVARTVPEQRHASVLPFTFADTSVEVIPCQLCLVDYAIVSLRITKSRAITLAWDEDTASTLFYKAHHRDGLVEFG